MDFQSRKTNSTLEGAGHCSLTEIHSSKNTSKSVLIVEIEGGVSTHDSEGMLDMVLGGYCHIQPLLVRNAVLSG